MQVRYINPFIDSAINVLQQMAGLSSERGDLGLRDSVIPNHEVAVVLGIVGQVNGQVAYSMSQESAKEIASRMMGGMPVNTFDQMPKSAIAELGNMITGNASAALEKQGIQCNISPPTLITGEKMKIYTAKLQTLVVPLRTELGIIEICVGVKEV
ncbi:MAG: chemotaxis protein CheX [bacterium]